MEHLVEHAPYSVDVAFEVDGPRAGEPFGRQVERRAQEGLGVVLFGVKFLGQAEVDQEEVSFPVEHHVLGLEVSVDDLLLVQVLDGEH